MLTVSPASGTSTGHASHRSGCHERARRYAVGVRATGSGVPVGATGAVRVAVVDVPVRGSAAAPVALPERAEVAVALGRGADGLTDGLAGGAVALPRRVA